MDQQQIMSYHGQFKLWQENQLILAEIHGAWSVDTAQDYAIQLKQLVQSMNGQPWARILYLDHWQLGTPDFEKVMKALMRWCVASAQIHSLCVSSKHNERTSVG